MSELKFIQVQDAALIPRRLLEQVKGLPFDPQRFYDHWYLMQGPINMLFVIADTDLPDPVVGMLWLTVNMMGDSLDVNLLSMDREYQDGKFPWEVIGPRILTIQRAAGMKHTYWWTRHPKAFIRKTGGQCVQRDLFLMELTPNEEV